MFAMTLWLGNSAYLYISVAFAQMLKAIMPVAVFLLGAAFGLEEMSYKMLSIMSIISVGVIVASIGEITISWVGVVYQMGGVVAEALRLIFIEIFLKKKGVKLNLISMMYYVSPCSALCLFIPWLLLEKPKMDDSVSWSFPPFTLFLNCLCTFVLNLSVFLVISRTSALTARVTGVEKQALDFAELASSPWTRYILFILQISREYILYNEVQEESSRCSKRWKPELFVLGFLGGFWERYGDVSSMFAGLSPGPNRPAQPPSRAAAARCGTRPSRRQRGHGERLPQSAIRSRRALCTDSPPILKAPGLVRKMEEADSSESSVSDRKEEQQEASLPLPAAFLEFLSENGLDPAVYSMAASIPRYIRLKPGMESHVAEIERELKCCLEVSWLPGFYAIPPEIQIAGSKAYQQGKIYGIDAASGAAILALDVRPGDHVLDLCAAPGAKLCMLADILGNTGSLTGVDVAKHRLAACRTMLQKYSLGDRTRLFVADGTSFSLLPVDSVLQRIEGSTVLEDNGSTFSEWTSRRSWKDRQKTKKANAAGSQHLKSNSEPDLIYYALTNICDLAALTRYSVDNEASTSGYDKVLVDAECTHDGSIKHIQKFEFWGWKTLDCRVLDAERTDNLFDLQVPLSFLLLAWWVDP
ncbi:hypothetical protein PR202_gb28881 [Eleusine coracana subsp. coracana]|uniref:SAM-dependent MTase RsmB/NOP-type domain-containing protein n=1 Tax=Eleusine coracana subsp. coracana TaxID=191504 RepID=A0AAV5FVR6_ELECO|nr:hypothetical protein PR202_gb28881 [Eleusine coracana subsp. coracana]